MYSRFRDTFHVSRDEWAFNCSDTRVPWLWCGSRLTSPWSRSPSCGLFRLYNLDIPNVTRCSVDVRVIRNNTSANVWLVFTTPQSYGQHALDISAALCLCLERVHLNDRESSSLCSHALHGSTPYSHVSSLKTLYKHSDIFSVNKLHVIISQHLPFKSTHTCSVLQFLRPLIFAQLLPLLAGCSCRRQAVLTARPTPHSLASRFN